MKNKYVKKIKVGVYNSLSCIAMKINTVRRIIGDVKD
jgi:hypothetical protein